MNADSKRLEPVSNLVTVDYGVDFSNKAIRMSRG